MTKDSRYIVEPEPRPEGAPPWWRPLWLVVDTRSSNRAVVSRQWRSGEAWLVAADANAGRRVL